MSNIMDQGEEQICVPCTLSAFLNWRENIKNGEVKDNKIRIYDIYDSRSNDGEGMTYKDAFKFLKKEGVNSKEGLLKINSYGRVTNILSLRHAIIMNGPCFGALPVYSNDYEFWNKKSGEYLLGYHAISIIGYDLDGFFIRNSWGTYFGDNGYTYIKNEDMGKMLEIWTIID